MFILPPIISISFPVCYCAAYCLRLEVAADTDFLWDENEILGLDNSVIQSSSGSCCLVWVSSVIQREGDPCDIIYYFFGPCAIVGMSIMC